MTDELLPPVEPAGGLRAGVDFGVVFALAIEAGGLVDRMQGVRVTRGHGLTVRQGLCHQRQVVLVESGAGRAAAAQAAQALLDAHRPAWVFSAGFAGGLVSELRRGDLLVADCLVDTEGHCWTADPATLPPWLANVRRLRVGRLLTCDRPVRLPAEKRALARRIRPWPADMESLAVAEVCRRRNVPFLAVRAVCDAVDDEAAPRRREAAGAEDHRGPGRGRPALGLRCPASLKDLFAMQQNALACSDRLARIPGRGHQAPRTRGEG